MLETRPHIIIDGKPYLKFFLKHSTEEKLTQILRWARSYRLLGIITDIPEIVEWKVFYGEKYFFFICDAFDGDSIVVTKLKIDQ